MSSHGARDQVKCADCLHCEPRRRGGYCYEKGHRIEDPEALRYCRPYQPASQASLFGGSARTRRPR